MDRFDPDQLVGARLIGPGQQRIGKISQVLLDDRTGAPQWVTVRTGVLPGGTSVIPLSGARLANNGSIQVPYSKDQVKDAPSVPVDGGHLSTAEQASLYRYYGSEQAGLSPDAAPTSAGQRHPAHTEREPVDDPTGTEPGRRLRPDDRGGKQYPSATDDLEDRNDLT